MTVSTSPTRTLHLSQDELGLGMVKVRILQGQLPFHVLREPGTTPVFVLV